MHTQKLSPKHLAALSLGALGVVFGDIGTSPLYAINEIFFGHGRVELNALDILGSISLVFWALMIIVTFKYVFLVLKADNEGEGGVFALFGHLSTLKENNGVFLLVVSSLLIFAAGLLFGDGIITPAISVLSAVEGLKLATASLAPYVVPITIAILTGLFFIQKRGTSQVGKVFGPIVLLWFISLAALGLYHLASYPAILQAINPIYAWNVLTHSPLHAILWVLGSVMLTITGGEAMFADMGHFGRAPIRLSWFTVVLPALLLNYFGQGAFLLKGGQVVGDNLFFSTVPSWGIYPMVILATFATIIASQAMISGAFSLASQAVRLGYLPRIKIIHTHDEHEGQIYVPAINWLLYIGCVALVLIFQSSSRLASAYGLAVSGDMVITSLAMILITTHIWKWHKVLAFSVFGGLLAIELSFLFANSLKLIEGGFIPLGIALVIWFLMKTWAWGRKQAKDTFEHLPAMTVKHLSNIKKNSEHMLPKTMIVMTPYFVQKDSQSVHAFKQMFWNRYGVLPEHLVFLYVKVLRKPHVHAHRYEVTTFYEHPKKGSIRSVLVQFGFMEELNVEKVLFEMAADKQLPIGNKATDWLVHIASENITLGKKLKGLTHFRFTLFRFMLYNSMRTDQFFGLGKKVGLTVEVIPVTYS